MTKRLDRAVDERHWQLCFDELAGRAAPPDRSAAILARARSADGERSTRPAAVARRARVLAAAILVIGAAATVIVAALGRAERAAGPRGGSPTPIATGPERASDPAARDGRPAGTDPADLRARRSAEAMLAAEQKLARQLAEGRIAGVDQLLPFAALTGWTYTRGLEGMPSEVRALDGQRVVMTGFMLPIDEVEGMTQFLLVRSLWACCYGQPPDVHGLVRCVMPAGRTTEYAFEPIKVAGRFAVGATEQDGYVVDVFQLHVALLETIE